MTLLALLRHGPTEWNGARRLQGRADIPLSETSREELRRRQLPGEFSRFRTLSSPLARCLETAALLGLTAKSDARLIEMDWGSYQGYTANELRTRYGVDFERNELRGLDFLPPEGESPRQVQTRVAPLLAEVAAGDAATLAITHRGVIRAIYASAVGWDMTEDPPHRLDLYALQLFRLAADGTPAVERLNVPLDRRGADT
jgi:broad specificity phosphatase PhoE